MKIKVLGKAHREGTSKRTGMPYNFNQLHYLGKEQGVEGQAACTLNLDPGVFPFDNVQIGKEYDVEFNGRGYVVGFTPAS